MDFLSFVVWELFTFEFVVSNRSPPGPLIKKFCLVQIRLRLNIGKKFAKVMTRSRFNFLQCDGCVIKKTFV